jgi:hypothetical protein
MQWIFDNFQVFILIALGIGSVIKSLLDAKARQKEQGEKEYDPGEVFAPDEDYEQTMPSGPPPIHRQSVPPPLRQDGYQEAVAEETARALKHQQELAERLRVIRETKATTTGGAQATRARISTRGTTVETAAVPSGIRARLRNPAEVRRAVAMREILGPPVSLR